MELELYSKLTEAISEIENGAKGVEAEKFIKKLMKGKQKKSFKRKKTKL